MSPGSAGLDSAASASALRGAGAAALLELASWGGGGRFGRKLGYSSGAS